ncbi:hypothetical protein [Azorhizobium caulinodans]|uniref:hypothetical protein n=1 Tax=Azorhizobium caulinodans TaxID=7 RepID=UPI002FBDFFAC
MIPVVKATPSPDQQGAALSSGALLSRTGGDLSRSGGNERFYHPWNGGRFYKQFGNDNPRFSFTVDGLRDRQDQPADASNTLDVCDFGCEDFRNDNGFDVLRHSSPRADDGRLPPRASIASPFGVVNARYGQLLIIEGEDIAPHAMRFALLAIGQPSLCSGQQRSVSSPLSAKALAAEVDVEGNPIGLGCSREAPNGTAQRSAQGARRGWGHDRAGDYAPLCGLAAEVGQPHERDETDDAVFGLHFEPRSVDARDNDRLIQGRFVILSVCHAPSVGGAA